MPIESKKGSQLPTNESPAKKVWLIGFSEENSESVKYPLADLINKFEEGDIIPGKANGLTPESDEAQRIEEAETLIQGLELTKANKNGAYPQMQVGLADNLKSPDGITNSEPYLDRTTAGSDSVATGLAELQKIKGNTLVSNQQMYNGDFAITTGITNAASYNNNYSTLSLSIGKCTLTMVQTTSSYYQCMWRNTNTYTVTPVYGHKYYVSFECKAPKSTYLRAALLKSSSSIDVTSNASACPASANTRTRLSCVLTASSSFNGMVGFAATPSNFEVGDTVEFYNAMVIDLTKMFGEGKEPTADEFNALYPQPYYAYNTGELISVNVVKLKTVGFNAYNHATKTAELIGGLTPDTGQAGTYQITGAYTSLSYECANGATETIAPDTNGFFTPVNSGVLTVTGGNATTTCVHLVWSGYRNGEYETYKSNELDLEFIKSIKDSNGNTLFPEGLCSVGNVYDEITPTKAIKRVGVVDLGSLDWTISGSFNIFNSPLPNCKGSQTFLTVANILNAKYKITYYDYVAYHSSDKSIAVNPSGTAGIYDSSYTDTATFKTAMSGVYLYYELATPIEVTFDEPLNLTYQMDDFGTEEVIPTTGKTTAPFVADTFYMNNLRDKIRNIDGNTDAGALMNTSLANLLATLGTALNGTLTKTWDTTNKCWTFTFTPSTPE